MSSISEVYVTMNHACVKTDYHLNLIVTADKLHCQEYQRKSAYQNVGNTAACKELYKLNRSLLQH